MALNIQTVTIKTLGFGDLTREVIVVAGTGDTAEVLIKSGMPADVLATLTTIEADGVGATLKAKMQAYVLPNGKTAWAVMGDSVKTMAEFKQAYILVDAKSASAGEIAGVNAVIQEAKVDLVAVATAADLAAAQALAASALATLSAVA